MYLTQREKLAVYMLITKAVAQVSNKCVMKDLIKKDQNQVGFGKKVSIHFGMPNLKYNELKGMDIKVVQGVIMC